MKLRALCLAALGLAATLAARPAAADTLSSNSLTPACLAQAANLQHLPITILLAVMRTEGGHVGTESRNRDGSYDLGPMQVNDRTWVATLAEMHFHGDRALAREEVRDNGCYNVNVGAWIFKKYLVEADGDFPRAIGFYNSHNPYFMRIYQRRVAENFEKIVNALRPFMLSER